MDFEWKGALSIISYCFQIKVQTESSEREGKKKMKLLMKKYFIPLKLGNKTKEVDKENNPIKSVLMRQI